MKKKLNIILFSLWGMMLLSGHETNAGEQVKQSSGTVVVKVKEKVKQLPSKVKEKAQKLKEKVKNPKRSAQNDVTLTSVRSVDPDVQENPKGNKPQKRVRFADQTETFIYEKEN